MLKSQNSSSLFVVLCLILVFDFEQVYAVPYDYSFTHECLSKPLSPQYHGGIVVNPEINEELNGWTAIGDAKLEHAESHDGNKYIVVSNRNVSFSSFSQTFNLDKDKLYTFSAWLQVSSGNADIAAIFKTKTSYEIVGWVPAQKGCWSMLKGGLVVNETGTAKLYFESKNPTVDIWADSISLQPFTQEEWKSHQDESITKWRKGKVKLQVMDQHGQPIRNATVSIKQHRSGFPFGCAINQNILNNNAYQNWFSSRFKYTVFENELKWYSTEKSKGSEDYSVSDALVKFAKSRGVAIRGHNVFWDDSRYEPSWVGGLSTNDLRASTNKRIHSVLSRYKGQLFHWDVVNENLHFSFFESKLGQSISTTFYQQANKIDGRTIPFLNDYNTIEDNRDGDASPSKYLQKIAHLRREGYNGPLGIGLEGHFTTSPNLAYIRSAIDTLASAKLPIWVTELDVTFGPNQATFLDQILREVHSHSAVQGIIIWAAWSPQGCYRMCLTDNNFKNLATGDVVDKFRVQLTSIVDSNGTTDSNGMFEASLFHGEYAAKIIHPIPNGGEISDFQTFNVGPNKDVDNTFQFKVEL